MKGQYLRDITAGVIGARRDGHDDKTIIDHLSIDPTLGEQVDRARASGMSDGEIVHHVAAAGRALDPVVTPVAPERLYQRAVDANPKGLTFNEDMMADVQSQMDNLASDFIDHNLDHYTRDEVTDSHPSAPQPEFVDAIYKLSKTALGRQILTYGRDNGLHQKVIYDPGIAGPDDVDIASDEWRYDPAALQRDVGQRIEGDGRDTADFNVVTGHALGHTAMGRGAPGLPRIMSDKILSGQGDNVFPPPSYVSPQRHAEEVRDVRLVENPLRRAWGLPARTTYSEVNDVYGPKGLVR
jgi:hypothetical protein